MKFIVAGNLVINPDHVGYVERIADGGLHVHMALPVLVGGVSRGEAPPVATDHEKIYISPAGGAEHVWQSLLELSKTKAAA